MRALTTALTTIRRSPYQALASILVVSVTFFVGFSFSLLLLGADQILSYFETRPQVIAFFELNTDPATVAQVQQSMEQKPYVEEAKVVNQEEALRIYQENNKDEPLLLELVTADILPVSIEVSAVDVAALPQIKQDLSTQPSIDDIDFQESIVNQLTTWTTSLRLLGVGVIITLATISLLTITVIIAMKASSQRKAMNIMRLIGATRWYVKTPFMLEGMLYGLFGALIGWVVMYAGLLYVTPDITNFMGEIKLLPVPTELLLAQLGIGVLAGVILGGFAGLLALQRLIRR